MKALILAVLLALPFPRPASYQNNSSQGGPVIKPNNTIDTARVKERARWSRTVLDIAPFGNFGTPPPAWYQVPALIRFYNPTCDVLGYIQTQNFWHDSTWNPDPSDHGFWTDYWRCLYHYDAWLYTPDGQTRGEWNVNWGNAAFADSMGTLLIRQWQLGIWNGLFLDSWMEHIKWTGEGVNPPIDYVRAGFANGDQMDSARTVNMSRQISRLKAAGAVVWTNSGGTPVANDDADMREGFMSLFTLASTVAWIQTKDVAHWLKAEWYGGGQDSGEWYTREACKFARFGLGISCMGDGCYSIGAERFNTQPWYDEFAIGPWPYNRADSPQKQTGWLGQPGDLVTISPGFYVRWFDNGAVLINTTNTVQTWFAWKTLWRIQGYRDPYTNTGQSGWFFAVPGQDALFLRKRPEPAKKHGLL